MEVVGIDIAKRKFDLAWLSGKTGKIRNKAFENSPVGFQALCDWLVEQGISANECRVVMEATSQYYEALAHAMFDAGYLVSVVNPLQIKAFGQSEMRRQKTDRADAELIARFGEQSKKLVLWEPPATEVRELQRLIARLEAVQGMHVQEQNRRHEAAGQALESVDRILLTLKEEEALLTQKIRDHIDRHPGLRNQQELLRSIPGVGERVSSYFLAWLPVDRFDNIRQMVAFVGLSPEHNQSGDSVHGKSHLCKLGHGRLRKILYCPAMTAIRFNPAAQALYARLRAAGKGGKVALVAVMRKLIHWMMAVLKSNARFDPKMALAKN
ncbi:IS110 family transposase [Massilia sp. R2A-15]|uniref:IS110 family transposase n=1 Tax=Massilia sp. R2A-15 TaxID=3064278 RepID=UPI00273705E4|nr:IS110 family transposase [Massilia sp. R2A-15]WLI88029.1 IS110 family transposase [Massilia sp. R2A-15]WLI88402.1 IS110 family transposase [Massilia sp. R2A-15]WLI89707.1 IS110 family transposase [Massilia sp. R2A-15]